MCQLFAGQPRQNYCSQTRSLRLNGQSTSIRLEEMFWNTLDGIAASENLSTPQFISRLHSEVMSLHGEASNFTSLLRCTCLVHAERQHTRSPQPKTQPLVDPDWLADNNNVVQTSALRR